MALTKEDVTGKVEMVGEWKHLQVRIDTVIKEDGVEISRKYWRRAYTPGTDLEAKGACDEAKQIAAIFWTDEHIAAYKSAMEAQAEPPPA